MATLTDNERHAQPVCQNCKTSTTPLWRRDEIGSVLCNACGLFLKLHGRPRPISLKTDVIKSRNRVKSSGSAPKKKVCLSFLEWRVIADKVPLQSVFGANGGPRSEAGTPPPDHRRISLKSSGASDRSNSPISRTGTPSLHQRPNIGQPQLFDHARHQESAFTHSSSLPALQLLQPSSGSNIAPHDRHLEPPQPYESLHHANTTLKTQVSELEVINGLYKGRVQELERAEVTQSQLRKALEQSQAREIELKKRVEDLEREVLMLRREGTSVQHQHPQEYSRPPQYLPQQQKRRLDDESAGNLHPEKSPPSTKRSRLSDVSDFANQTLPTTTTS